MADIRPITPPLDENDAEGAHRVFEEFFVVYQPTLIRLECKLHDIIEESGPTYSTPYRAWHKALHDLVRGVHMIARRFPLPDAEGFAEALRIFSFDGAAKLLNDLIITCRLPLAPNWAERFKENIKLLLFSFSILQRQMQKQEAGLSI